MTPPADFMASPPGTHPHVTPVLLRVPAGVDGDVHGLRPALRLNLLLRLADRSLARPLPDQEVVMVQVRGLVVAAGAPSGDQERSRERDEAGHARRVPHGGLPTTVAAWC